MLQECYVYGVLLSLLGSSIQSMGYTLWKLHHLKEDQRMQKELLAAPSSVGLPNPFSPISYCCVWLIVTSCLHIVRGKWAAGTKRRVQGRVARGWGGGRRGRRAAGGQTGSCRRISVRR